MYLIRVGAVLVFGAIGSVTERFAAAGELTHVRLFTSV